MPCTLSRRSAKLDSLCQSLLNLAKEHRPEQARTHIGVVADVVTAVVRTVVRAIGSRTVRVVEHPKRSRRRQRQETTVATDLSLQPIPHQGESGHFSILKYLPIFLYLISFSVVLKRCDRFRSRRRWE